MQPKAVPVDVFSLHSCLHLGPDRAGAAGDKTWENSSETQA